MINIHIRFNLAVMKLVNNIVSEVYCSVTFNLLISTTESLRCLKLTSKYHYKSARVTIYNLSNYVFSFPFFCGRKL